ncbi:MAG TPA: DnaB-like helicase C-terminal domain-containing protein [Gemmatimonadaceae bacterium]
MTQRVDDSPLSQLVQRVDAVADGAPAADTIPVGFPSVDRVLGGGLRRGDLVALGGDVASGKTSLALAFALRAAQRGRGVLFLTGEATVERTLERALVLEGRARVDDVRRGSLDDAARAGLGAAALRLREGAPAIERIPRSGVDTLSELVTSTPGVELLVVDALQSLATGRGGREEELAAACRRLKRLALDLDVAVLATMHLPRLDRGRKDLRPQLDDFGALGAPAQEADVVLGLYREEMYVTAQGVEGATELSILKNRTGGTGYIDLFFYKQWLRFEDMLEPGV